MWNNHPHLPHLRRAGALRLVRRALLRAALGALLPASCAWEEDAPDNEAQLPPPAPVVVQPQVIRCRKAARNGELPPGEESIPEDYAQFRGSNQYRTSLRTWRDAQLLERSGHRSIVIELTNQRGQCFVDGQLAMDFPVCTGTPSHPTPTGSFRISEKDPHHRSNLYHCPMPLFMRLTNDGIGLHIGDVFRVPASHGCIRLTREACSTLFRDLPHGTQVDILP